MNAAAILTIFSLLVVILVLVAVVLELRGRLEEARTLEIEPEPEWFDFPLDVRTNQGRRLDR